MKTKTFEERLSSGKMLELGSRNNNIPVIVKISKECGLELEEALTRLQALWPMDKNDIGSFRRAWPKFEPDIKLSAKDIINGALKKRTEVSQAQESIDNEVRFIDWLSENTDGYVDWWKQHSPKIDAKDSSVFQKIFSKDDIVWTGRNVEADTGEMRDLVDYAGESLEDTNYFVINPFRSLDSARKDDEVKCFKHILLESDSLKLGEQFILWRGLIERGLPVKSVVHTGGKSIHCLVEVHGIENAEDYRSYFMEIKKLMDRVKPDIIDEKCKNPSRLSRTPFALRKVEKEYGFDEVLQKLMYLDERPPQNDALEIIREWVKELVGAENKEEQSLDEIEDMEILNVVRMNGKIKDIWVEDENIYVKMINPTSGSIEVKNMSEKVFWILIRDELKEIFHQDFKIDELKRGYKIRFKHSYKMPFIGTEEPIRKDRTNLFVPGWLGEALNDDSIPNELDERHKIMLLNLFGDDEMTMKWTLQWMRKFMHDFKVMTAPVFWGHPGVGKSMLAEAFGEAIGDWTKTPANKDDIRFNDWLRKTVIIFEESSSGTKREGKDFGDLLKDWITSDSITVEAKGKDAITVEGRRCFIFNSNISDIISPVYIEDKDRRFTVIKNDEGVNLITLWKPEDYRWWDDIGKKQLMKWIYLMPEDPGIDLSAGVDNQAKHEVQELSRPSFDIVLEEILQDNDGMNLSSTDILDMLRERGIKSGSTITIAKKVKQLGYVQTMKQVCIGVGETKMKRIWVKD